MQKSLVHTVLVLLFLFQIHTVWGKKETTIYLKNTERIDCKDFLSFFVDSSNLLTINNIIDIEKQGKFKSSNQIPSVLDQAKSNWIYFKIVNELPNDFPWMINFNSPFSAVEVFALSENQFTKQIDTVYNYFESVNNYHKIKITINPVHNCTTQYYIRLHTDIPMACSLDNCHLTHYRTFLPAFIFHASFVGFIIGLLFLMMIYTISKYIGSMKKVYLYYVFYIFFHLLFVLQGSYLVEYVLVKDNQLSLSWLYLSFSYGVIFYILFVREFIEPKNLPAKLDSLFYKPYIVFVLLANIAMTLLTIIDNKLFYFLVFQIPVLYGILGLILVVLLLIYVKQLVSKLVLIGTCITIITGVLSILVDEYSLLDNNHIYNIGMVLDIFFFSFALSLKQKIELAEIRKKEEQYKEMQLDLELKQRQLTSKVLLIKQQDQLLVELQERYEELKDTDEIDSDEINSVFSLIENHITQNSWEEFERYFVDVHPTFYKNVKADYPSLSQNELKICALLKLNMNTKQIADITQKSGKSIDVSRSRIRKKMGLSRDANLFDVISLYS